MVELRVLAPDDWTVWRDLRLAALAEAPHAFGELLAEWQGENDREERWRARLSLPGSYSVVALLEGRPIGMSGAVPTGREGVVELVSMWVAPTARGRGVGDSLLRAVELWSRDIGARLMLLSVAPGNEPALSLYLRNGFTHTDEPGALLRDGVRRYHIMAKSLAVE